MKNESDIKELLKMTIGQIKQLKESQMKVQNVIEQQEESVAYVIEQEKIDEDWAEKFLEDMEIKE